MVNKADNVSVLIVLTVYRVHRYTNRQLHIMVSSLIGVEKNQLIYPKWQSHLPAPTFGTGAFLQLSVQWDIMKL